MNSEDIRDIKGLFDLYGWYRPGLWLALLVVVALAVGWWLRRRRKPVLAPVAPPRPAHVLALEALERLRPQLEGSPKPFHFSLSEILRAYLEARFSLPATDRTTEEIQQLFAGTTVLSESQKTDVVQVLKTTDLVKFTDFVPVEQKSLQAWEQARAFVNQTVPPPPPVPEKGAKK